MFLFCSYFHSCSYFHFCSYFSFLFLFWFLYLFFICASILIINIISLSLRVLSIKVYLLSVLLLRLVQYSSCNICSRYLHVYIYAFWVFSLLRTPRTWQSNHCRKKIEEDLWMWPCSLATIAAMNLSSLHVAGFELVDTPASMQSCCLNLEEFDEASPMREAYCHQMTLAEYSDQTSRETQAALQVTWDEYSGCPVSSWALARHGIMARGRSSPVWLAEKLCHLESFLKIPSKWENFVHNGLICFFQHNYIPTFEQWLWDRVCVLSTLFGDICGSRKDFCMFYKRSRPLISNSIRCGCLRTDQRGGDELCRVISAVRVCRCRRKFAILFLDTLCGVVFIRFSGPRFPVLVDIRLVTVNWHARCSL